MTKDNDKIAMTDHQKSERFGTFLLILTGVAILTILSIFICQHLRVKAHHAGRLEGIDLATKLANTRMENYKEAQEVEARRYDKALRDTIQEKNDWLMIACSIIERQAKFLGEDVTIQSNDDLRHLWLSTMPASTSSPTK